MIPLALVDGVFHNYAEFSPHVRHVPTPDAVRKLFWLTGRLFGRLGEEDEAALLLKTRIWRLRAIVQFTLLPFNDEDVALQQEADALTSIAHSYPPMSQECEELRKVVSDLLAISENPKATALDELLGSADGCGPTALVTALSRGRVPGWSDAVVRKVQHRYPDLEHISSKSAIEQTLFEQVILPSGGQLCPLLKDLCLRGRTQRLDLLAYRGERVAVEQPRSLPLITRTRSRRSTVNSSTSEEDREEFAADAWIQQRFWEALRATRVQASAQEPLIKARLVILANTKKIFLEADQKIIEIGAVLDGTLTLEELGSKLPRKRVADLSAGDRIAMRTSRGGNYLVEVADDLLERNGRAGLRAEALDWKPLLEAAIRKCGTQTIAQRLASKGHVLSDHRYIWMWTTDRVMRPETQEVFYELIAILDDLGFSTSNANPVALAQSRWALMRELIHFHHLAGNQIRRALLWKLRELLDRKAKIEDEMHLTLAGVDAGSLSVFRITDIDQQVVDVPYYELDVIRDVEESWRG